ncbi:hypothetical protein [Natronoglomus mannanivorans]|uniref:Uncharacterized protein n=1 Tax=Natronoglomus mannanivorans TaxID=2979990 RepID=A0AAP2Z193_9EURY|nr:hypothetical protein [Halobacteria archaeon AArc-xg1-1]
MRYIHNGELRNRTIDPPTVFVFDEPNASGLGRTNTAAHFGRELATLRKTEKPKPLCLGHELSRSRWSE